MRITQLITGFSLGVLTTASLSTMAATYDLQLGNYNNQTPYMRDLIKTALEEDGHTVNLTVLDKSHKIRRIIKQVSRGNLKLLWTGRGRQFKEKSDLLTIDIGLTKGFKAKQVMFINKGTQGDYENITDLDQFRGTAKKGVFGTGWAASNFWKASGLDYVTIDGGSTDKITNMMLKGNRGFDYFSRGVLSASKILKENPSLELEKNLIIEFDDDFIVYLHKDQQQLQQDLEKALKKAQAGNLMDRLLRKHFPDTFDKSLLNYDGRTKITLKQIK